MLSECPSPKEAWHSLPIALRFLEGQPEGYLELQESMLIGRLLKMLKSPLNSQGGVTGKQTSILYHFRRVLPCWASISYDQ